MWEFSVTSSFLIAPVLNTHWMNTYTDNRNEDTGSLYIDFLDLNETVRLDFLRGNLFPFLWTLISYLYIQSNSFVLLYCQIQRFLISFDLIYLISPFEIHKAYKKKKW